MRHHGSPKPTVAPLIWKWQTARWTLDAHPENRRASLLTYAHTSTLMARPIIQPEVKGILTPSFIGRFCNLPTGIACFHPLFLLKPPYTRNSRDSGLVVSWLGQMAARISVETAWVAQEFFMPLQRLSRRWGFLPERPESRPDCGGNHSHRLRGFQPSVRVRC